MRRSLPLLSLLALFGISRALASHLGLRFRAADWPDFWHAIEPELFETRFLESVFYLHAQPPLFNLVLGTVHVAAGPALPEWFALGYRAIGLALAVTLFCLARELGAGRWTASLAATLFALSPASLLFENYLFYTYPVALLVALVALGLARCARRGRTVDFLWCACAAGALVLTRSLFHPIWLLCVLGWAAVLAHRHGRLNRRTLALLSLPLMACLLVVLKNAWVVGHPGLSTWRGMNLARATIDRLPEDKLKALVDAGTVSSFSTVGPFQPLEAYDLKTVDRGVPLLDRPRKKTGAINFHHAGYIRVARKLESDAFAVMAAHPLTYIAGVGRSLGRTFHSATAYRALAPIRPRLSWLEDPWRAWTGAKPTGIVPAALIAVPLTLLFLMRLAYLDRAKRHLAGFIVFNVCFVILLGACLERSENERFRFLIDPLLWAGAAAGVSRVLARVRSRERAQRYVSLHRRDTRAPSQMR